MKLERDIPNWMIFLALAISIALAIFMVWKDIKELDCYDECMEDYCGGQLHNIACDSISFQKDNNMTIAEEECYNYCEGEGSIFDY